MLVAPLVHFEQFLTRPSRLPRPPSMPPPPPLMNHYFSIHGREKEERMDGAREQTTSFNEETRCVFLANNRPARHWASSMRMCVCTLYCKTIGFEGSSCRACMNPQGCGIFYGLQLPPTARSPTHKHENFATSSTTFYTAHHDITYFLV